MNTYKLRALMDFIKKQGQLPADEFGNVLCSDDLIVWYGLNDLLSVEEQRLMKKELAQLAEAEDLVNRLGQGCPFGSTLLARAHADPLS